MGLSSAIRQTTARSAPLALSGVRFVSGGAGLADVVEEPIDCDQLSVVAKVGSWSELETDAVRNRLGMEFRRISPSIWLFLNRSTAEYSEGRRRWACTLPGVEGPILPREGDDAIEDTEVEGDGGLVFPFGYKSQLETQKMRRDRTFGSKLVKTLVGLFIFRDILRLR
jgi:hypothetical protein